MTFTNTSRVWWNTANPGSGTAFLSDASPAENTDNDTGWTGRIRGDIWVICARSGFGVPFSDSIIDPNTGQRVWRRFVDRPAIVTGQIPRRPGAVDDYRRPLDYPTWEP